MAGFQPRFRVSDPTRREFLTGLGATALAELARPIDSFAALDAEGFLRRVP